MRKIGHWTPRYIWNRLGMMARERLHPGRPWLTAAMNDILDTWLRSTDVGIEFGSGRSTVWLGARVKQLTSVEHDQEWYQRVSRKLREESALQKMSVTNINLALCKHDLEDEGNSEYVAMAKLAEVNSLDFCLIDGIARDYCAVHCLDKLKRGGIVIVDNVERYIPQAKKSWSPNARGPADGYASDLWKQFGEEVVGWRAIWTSDGVSDTALWVRP